MSAVKPGPLGPPPKHSESGNASIIRELAEMCATYPGEWFFVEHRSKADVNYFRRVLLDGEAEWFEKLYGGKNWELTQRREVEGEIYPVTLWARIDE